MLRKMNASINLVFDINLYVNVLEKEQYLLGVKKITPDELPHNLHAQCLAIVAEKGPQFSLNLSQHIIDNVYYKLTKKHKFESDLVNDYIDYLLSVQENSNGQFIHTPAHNVSADEVSNDYEDSLILDLALETNSRVVVTDDNRLMSNSPFRGYIPIISANKFINQFY